MPASKAQRAKTADRRRRAIAMCLAGADFETIATQLDYASRGAAYTDITRALETSLREQARDAEVWRHLLLLRMLRLQAAMWPAALQGDPKSADTALRIIDRICKLTGADEATRVEVITMSAIEAEIQRLSKELASDAHRGVPSEPSFGLLGGPETGAAA